MVLRAMSKPKLTDPKRAAEQVTGRELPER